MRAGRRRYSIWAPDYKQWSAGVRALYQLCERLQAAGYETEIGKRRKLPDSIVLYPEIVTNNPWKARRAVMWALQARVAARPEDQVWAWSSSFLEALNAQTGRNLGEGDVLNLPLVEVEIFNNQHNSQRREGAVFYKFDELRGTAGMTEITRDWPAARQEMAALLRRSEYLMCGKMSTLIDEARFCGCPVLASGFEKPTQTEYGMDGVCWSLDELDEARGTVDEALPKYIAYHAHVAERLERFIRRTQEMA